jgi:hypothetical protein
MTLILFLMLVGVGLVALVLGLTEYWRPPLYWAVLTAPPIVLGMAAFRGQDVSDIFVDAPGDLFACGVLILLNLAAYALAAWRLWESAVERFEAERSPQADSATDNG